MQARFFSSVRFTRFNKIVALLLLSLAFAGTVSAASAPAPKTQPTSKSGLTPVKSDNKSDWNKLTPAQRSALAPLAGDWNRLDTFRKEKWLELADRFATMSETDQARMQKRMQEWVRLSPEQRRIARENYTRVKKLQAKQKSRQWEQYQQLPEEKKKELAARASSKKLIANPPRQPRPGKKIASPKPGAQPTPVAESPAVQPLPVQSSPSTP